jgi:hypothetical protein
MIGIPGPMARTGLPGKVGQNRIGRTGRAEFPGGTGQADRKVRIRQAGKDTQNGTVRTGFLVRCSKEATLNFFFALGALLSSRRFFLHAPTLASA